MPRYFFDLKRENTHFDLDSEGVVLADMDAAEREALRAMGELLRDQLALGRRDDLAMQVRDEDGHRVGQTTITIRHAFIQPG